MEGHLIFIAFFWVFSYLIDEQSCLNSRIFTKLSQILCLTNMETSLIQFHFQDPKNLFLSSINLLINLELLLSLLKLHPNDPLPLSPAPQTTILLQEDQNQNSYLQTFLELFVLLYFFIIRIICCINQCQYRLLTSFSRAPF